MMTVSTSSKIAAALAVLMVLASCSNTIRGMGRDTANAVNATEDAGHTVKKAAQ
ncbi:entericidin A/B family lipoprotein [Rhizobium tropici]|uniref:Entericidin A/B family lipoprotein n=1 Tax=Rhizobium tropici TaxID=398 RepID=A0A5B0VVV1_RHITR|nr:entericidin A/B family lipoprotein [Rhizobium tropici]KAA1178820.1 entericidin A/B family lipoprotein [Rhizobium tropici]